MKTNELNGNEMEQVSGGNFFADLEEVLRRIFTEPSDSKKQADPTKPATKTGRGKC